MLGAFHAQLTRRARLAVGRLGPVSLSGRLLYEIAGSLETALANFDSDIILTSLTPRSYVWR